MNKRYIRLCRVWDARQLPPRTAGRPRAAASLDADARRSKARARKLAIVTVVMLASVAIADAAEPESRGQVNMDTAQPAIVRDAIDAAEWMAKRLSDTGYKGDFTLESLKDVDRFFDEQAPHGRPKAGGHLSHHFGMQIF